MRRVVVAASLALLAVTDVASAQSWVPWHQPGMSFEAPRQRSRAAEPVRPQASAQRRSEGSTRRTSRGERDASEPAPRTAGGSGPTPVNISTGHGAGTIVIDTSARRLYLMQSSNRALAYPVSVGRDGFGWTGTKRITRVASWPDWRPPAEMRAREPHLPQFVPGGPSNPLGAKALYLGSSLYRIHGTNNPRSVGQANSSGCFRLTNGNVVDLASRVGVGTKVVVR